MSDSDYDSCLITWTTYGTWLPGDSRGWRKRKGGSRLPRPPLEKWCREQMSGEQVYLASHDRETVEEAVRKHCEFRKWELLAVNARSNHVHVVVTANEHPEKVRDQLKANCTRCLRQQSRPLNVKRTWTRGGDCESLNSDEDIDGAIMYVIEAQVLKGTERA